MSSTEGRARDGLGGESNPAAHAMRVAVVLLALAVARGRGEGGRTGAPQLNLHVAEPDGGASTQRVDVAQRSTLLIAPLVSLCPLCANAVAQGRPPGAGGVGRGAGVAEGISCQGHGRHRRPIAPVARTGPAARRACARAPGGSSISARASPTAPREARRRTSLRATSRSIFLARLADAFAQRGAHAAAVAFSFRRRRLRRLEGVVGCQRRRLPSLTVRRWLHFAMLGIIDTVLARRWLPLFVCTVINKIFVTKDVVAPMWPSPLYRVVRWPPARAAALPIYSRRPAIPDNLVWVRRGLPDMLWQICFGLTGI